MANWQPMDTELSHTNAHNLPGECMEFCRGMCAVLSLIGGTSCSAAKSSASSHPLISLQRHRVKLCKLMVGLLDTKMPVTQRARDGEERVCERLSEVVPRLYLSSARLLGKGSVPFLDMEWLSSSKVARWNL